MLRYGLKNILRNPKFYLSPFWGVAEKFPNQMGNYIEPWTVWKVLVLDWNTRSHIILYKLLVLDKKKYLKPHNCGQNICFKNSFSKL